MRKLLNKLKLKIIKFLKTGDHVRFYIGEINHTGIVEKVYYIDNVKTAKIHYFDKFFERPVTEIYF